MFRPHGTEQKTGAAKIAVVSPNYGMLGGAEKFAFELTERLALMDCFEVHVLANKWRKGESPVIFHKVPIITFPRWFRPLSFALFAQKIIDTEGFDIVHSHERLFEYDLLTHHGLPHRTWIREIRKKRLSLFDRTMAAIEKKGIHNSKAPLVLPVSSMGKRELQKLFEIPESRIKVMHPGIPVKRFLDPDRDQYRSEIRDRHGFSPDDVVGLFVGMNFDVKGLDRILKGVAVFTNSGAKHPDFKLLVVGKGNFKKYSNLVHQLGLERRVVFVGEKNRVEEYFFASDIFLLMSYMDSFGIVVLEAMASGLPVIISDTVGACDVVENAHTGYVINCEHLTDEIAPALDHLMDPVRRRRMGTEARRVAVEFDWDVIAGKVADLYLRRLYRQGSFFKPST